MTRSIYASQSISLNYQVDTLLCEGAGTCVTNTSQPNLQFHWDIPNATPPVVNGYTPCFTFPTGTGDYPLHLTISVAGQCSIDRYATIHVHNPVAGGWVSKDTIQCPDPPQPITFTDTSKYNDGSVLWDFGDGAFSSLRVSNHIYTKPGRYRVMLRDSTLDGCVDSALIKVVVVQGPYGSLVVNPLEMCSCKDTVFFDISTYDATTFTLLYGCNAGNTTVSSIVPVGTQQNPTIFTAFWKFCRTDTCQPQMIFGDASGCQVFLNSPYIIIDSPVVDFTFDNYGVCVNGTVCFFDNTKYHFIH
jgi:hypothetical protein